MDWRLKLRSNDLVNKHSDISSRCLHIWVSYTRPYLNGIHGLGPEVIKLFSCSAELSMKLFLLINVKMPTIWHFNIYEQENSILGLSEPKKKPNFLISLYL